MAQSHNRWWDFPAALLLLLVMWTSAFRLSATEWTPHLNFIEPLVIIGLSLGLLLGQSVFTKRWMVGFSLVYSAFFIPLQLARPMGKEILWPERLMSLGGRIGTSFSLLFENQPILDPILFLGAMAALLWGVSLYAGYRLTRRGKPWLPVSISGLVQTSNRTPLSCRPTGMLLLMLQ